MVSRFLFLTCAAAVAVGVGGVALFAPEVMLASKQVTGNPAAQVWMREVGALLLAVGIMVWCVRADDDSPTLRALLWGNALMQLGLLPIELVAHAQGVIPNLMGVVPNTMLHVVLALGFVHYARAIRTHS